MAWRNLKQLSLADSLTSEHEALTELDEINELMDWEAIGHLLGDINDGDGIGGLGGGVLGAGLLGHEGPDAVQVDDGAVEFVVLLVEVTHTDLTEVTRVAAHMIESMLADDFSEKRHAEHFWMHHDRVLLLASK